MIKRILVALSGTPLTESAVTDEHLEEVKTILRQHPGNTPVTFYVLLDSGEKVRIKTSRENFVTITQELVLELKHLIGEDDVYVAANPKPLLREPKKKQWQKKR